MLSSHELFGFMSPALATKILEHAFEKNKDLYRATLASVAEARKLRPIFLERKPRQERNADIISMCAKPRLELIAANLIRDWLVTEQKAMLIDFLDVLGIPHKDGTVDDLPEKMEDEKLRAAVEKLLGQHPQEQVVVYLNAFFTMNQVQWKNLEEMLKSEARLQFGG